MLEPKVNSEITWSKIHLVILTSPCVSSFIAPNLCFSRNDPFFLQLITILERCHGKNTFRSQKSYGLLSWLCGLLSMWVWANHFRERSSPTYFKRWQEKLRWSMWKITTKFRWGVPIFSGVSLWELVIFFKISNSLVLK